MALEARPRQFGHPPPEHETVFACMGIMTGGAANNVVRRVRRFLHVYERRQLRNIQNPAGFFHGYADRMAHIAACGLEFCSNGLAGKTQLCRRIKCHATAIRLRCFTVQAKKLGVTLIMRHMTRQAIQSVKRFSAQWRNPFFKTIVDPVSRSVCRVSLATARRAQNIRMTIADSAISSAPVY